MSSAEEVILMHDCPVCHVRTKEVYEKEIHELSLKGGIAQSWMFKRMIYGEKPFESLRMGNWHFIICPQCGTVLNAEKCEKEVTVESQF